MWVQRSTWHVQNQPLFGFAVKSSELSAVVKILCLNQYTSNTHNPSVPPPTQPEQALFSSFRMHACNNQSDSGEFMTFSAQEDGVFNLLRCRRGLFSSLSAECLSSNEISWQMARHQRMSPCVKLQSNKRWTLIKAAAAGNSNRSTLPGIAAWEWCKLWINALN